MNLAKKLIGTTSMLLILCAPTVAAEKIPDTNGVNTAWKTYMSYRAITDKKSKQYEIQQKAYTDRNGLRKYAGRYLVAVGTPYGKVGDYIDVVMDNGEVINCIIGDSKSDRYWHLVYGEDGRILSYNVVEFIVDTPELDEEAKEWGDISKIDGFYGNVTEIVNKEELE